MRDLGIAISIMYVEDVGVSETPIPSVRVNKVLHPGIK